MKRKIFSILFALVLVLTMSLVTAVPVAAGVVPPSIFTVTGGTYTTTPTGETPYTTGDIGASLTGSWVDSAVIGDFTATGTGGLYSTGHVGESGYGTTADIIVSGSLSANEITFSGAAVRVDNDDITDDDVFDILGTVIIYSDGNFVADLSGTVTFGGTDYPVDLDITGSMVRSITNVRTEESFFTIQGAINAAVTDDIISVGAGTYSESQDFSKGSAGIIIGKSLTLEGANAGVPATEARSPESIITAPMDPLVDFAVLITGTETVATFDGFTIDNYEVGGILAGAFSPDEEDPLEVHILNNIVSAPSDIEDEHNNCIQVGDGTTGTIIGNKVFGAHLEHPDWSGSGIIVASTNDVVISTNYAHSCDIGIAIIGYTHGGRTPSEGNIIEYNFVENCGAAIGVQRASGGTIIRYNDVSNNDAGIESAGYPNDVPSGTEIHYNNIVGNLEYGVASITWGEVPGVPEQVDALYNWWDDETGPSHDTLNPGAQGDTVSDNVDFSPWLYEMQEEFISDAPCYAGSIVLDSEATLVQETSYAGGWNSFSTPVTLDDSADYISELRALVQESSLVIVRAQRFDLASQEWVALVMGGELTGDDYQIKPGEGFFIQVEKKGSLPILCSTNPTSPPRTDLVAGWNLVGLSNLTEMTVANALHNVDYSVVLSASPPNAETWSVPPALDTEEMKLGEAYWLGMGQPGILFGHTTTPVADDMTWELNQN